jgi:hypothetical protein
MNAYTLYMLFIQGERKRLGKASLILPSITKSSKLVVSAPLVPPSHSQPRSVQRGREVRCIALMQEEILGGIYTFPPNSRGYCHRMVL